MTMLLCFSITFLVSAIQSFIFDRRREKREQEKEQRDLEYHEERMKNLKYDECGGRQDFPAVCFVVKDGDDSTPLGKVFPAHP